MATAFRHLRMPPGTGSDGILASLRSTFLTPDFAVALVLSAAATWVLAVGVRRRGGAATAARIQLGLTVLAAVPMVEPLFFRCPVWAVAGAAAALALAWPGTTPRLQVGAPSVWHVAALVGGLGLALVPNWPGAQGDEPHYLLVAHSMVQDGDLDVADDYRMGEYRPVHPSPLSPHYRPGLVEGSRYSMHGAGFAATLAPSYALGAWASAAAAVALPRAVQVIVFAWFASLLVRLCVPLVGAGAAAVAVLLSCGLAPLLLAPLHLFPETLAMTASCAAFVQGVQGRAGWRDLLAGVALALLPWLGVKYIPLAIAVVVGVAVASDRWRMARMPLRPALAVCVPLIVSLMAHGLFTYTVYGSWSPSAVYLGADPAFTRQPGYGGDWLAYVADCPGALRTFIGYFLDQREGLLAVGPQFLLAAAGLPVLWRRRPRLAAALGFILLAYLVPYALSQQLGGHSPPARPVMAVAWTLVPALGMAVAASAGWLLPRAQAALTVAGVALTSAFVLDPTLLPHDYGITRSWLLERLAPAGLQLWRAFPSWVNLKEGPHWPVTLAWLLATLALAAWLAREASREGDARAAAPGRRRGAVAMLALTALVCAWGASLVVTARHRGATLADGVEAYVVAAVPELAWAEPGGVWVSPGGAREIIVVSDAAPGPSRITMRTLVDSEVTIAWRGAGSTAALLAGQPESIDADLGSGREWRGRRAVVLAVGASRGAAPADVEGGGDHRRLGAFIRVVALRADGRRE